MDKSFVQLISNFQSIRDMDESKITFTFSAYKNGPPGSGKSEDRIVIKDKLITIDFIKDQIDRLNPGWEFAFNSMIAYNHSRYHLPLIDFYCKKIDSQVIDSLKELKQEFEGVIYIFKTGRSFHGYHDILLTKRKWEEYLGSLLLLNKRTFADEIIDSRWIGHSLRQGYSSLRISHKTNDYLSDIEFFLIV